MPAYAYSTQLEHQLPKKGTYIDQRLGCDESIETWWPPWGIHVPSAGEHELDVSLIPQSWQWETYHSYTSC